MCPVVIDGKGHVKGRLAAAVAKQLLNGAKIVVVRCEDIVSNGDHRFNYHKYRSFLHKTTNTNPRDGPFHQRAPSLAFLRTVRGMVNYKTARGAAAFANLKTFVGVPTKYESHAKLVIPGALRVVAISADRPVTTLGQVATTFGWKYAGIVKKLETERIARAADGYAKRKVEKDKKAKMIAGANKRLGAGAAQFLETFVE
jgi:large subunit ribosomal protein L13Ae